MNLSQLIKQMDDIESGAPSFKRYINESVYNAPEMSKHWRKLDEGFVKGYDQYLKEVALTPDQIQNIFKQAGGGAAGGDAAKDPGKLAAIVDKVLPTSQAANLEKSLPEPDAGPVQGFEQKAAAAVQNLPSVDSGTKQSLMQLVKAGIKKPETQQLILAAVGAGLGSLISKVGPILSMIPGGGPVASAITGAVVAGGVAVLAAKLRGEDWKSAFKGAIKPALMGGASAVIGNLATTAIGALTSGSGSATDTAAVPGASVGVGDKMPDGSEVTGLDGGQVTVKHPDGTSETLSTQDYYGRTGQQGIADPNAAPAPSDKPHRQLPAWAQEMQAKQQQINDFAQQMGLPPGKHDVQMQGGVPISIDGQLVPQELYTPAQQRNIAAAQQMSAANANSERLAQQAGAGTSDYPSAGKVRANLDQWRADTGSPNAPSDSAGAIEPRGGWGAQEKINAMMQAKADAGIDPSTNQPYATAPASDYPSAGKVRANLDQWRADNAAGGPTAGGVPVGSTPDGINRLTGQPISSGPTWDQMTPDQQAATIAKQQQQAADAAAGAQNAKDYWANKPAYTRGLKESFAESTYVDKQATLKMWLDQEARGLAVSGLALKPAVKEGIMDSLKGMFGGKKDAAAPAGGGVTADALNKAWTAAGSPTDSEEVAKVLQGAGVPAETVTKIFTDLKLPAPGATPSAPEKVEPTMDPATAPADAAATPPAADPAQQTATAPTTPGAEPPATPQAEKQSKLGVGQINKVIPTLRVRDLKSVQKNVDATLAKRGPAAPAPQPTAEGKYAGFYSKFLGKEI